MIAKNETRLEAPRLRGVLEVVPLSLDQYHRMIETGILEEGAPIELHEGYLICNNRDLGHAGTQNGLGLEVPHLNEGVPLWPLSLDQYHRMIQEGVIGEDDPLELIDGYLVAKDQGRGSGIGHGPVHATAVRQLEDLLKESLGPSWMVQSQLPISLGDSILGGGKEPEPDGAVAQGPRSRYKDHHPGPSELRLVAEVADSSLANDRNVKGPLFASAGIPLYWIVNLVDRQLEVYSDPDTATGQYRSKQILTEQEQVTLSWHGLDPVMFRVSDFLP